MEQELGAEGVEGGDAVQTRALEGERGAVLEDHGEHFSDEDLGGSAAGGALFG